jgi:hypothetical protein
MFITIRFFLADVRSLVRGSPNPYVGALGGSNEKWIAIIRIGMQIAVSLVILWFAIGVIKDPTHSDKTKELAAGFLGSIVGYWIR